MARQVDLGPQRSYTREQMEEWKRLADLALRATESGPDTRAKRVKRHAAHAILAHGNPAYMVAAMSLLRTPVTIEEFIDSPEFLGKLMEVWPTLRADLCTINADVFCGAEPYFEALLGGATSTGKTTLSHVTNMYQLYLFTCLSEPQKLFDLSVATPIVFMFQSVSQTVTKRVIFKPFRQLFLGMPFTQKWVQWDANKESTLDLGNNITCVPALARVEDMVGQAIAGGMIDECLSGGTPIARPSGAATPIEDLRAGDAVVAWDEGRSEFVADVIVEHRSTGKKPVYQVTLDDGSTILATGNHPFLTEHGWKGAIELSPGEEVLGAEVDAGSARGGAAENAAAVPGPYLDRTLARANEPHVARSRVPGEDQRQPVGDQRAPGGERLQPVSRSGDPEAGPGQQRKDALAGDAGEAERCPGRLPGSAGLPVALPDDRGQAVPGEEVLPVVVGSGVRAAAPGGSQGAIVRLRDGARAVPDGRGTAAVDAGGLPHPLRGWPPSPGGDQAGVPPGSRLDEDRGGAQACRGAGLGLHTPVRRRVRSVRLVEARRVYNIETARTHTYVAGGVVVHNCNFMSVVEDSKQVPGPRGQGGRYDQAEDTYRNIVRRRTSRFNTLGPSLGIICTLSSTRYKSDFMDRRMDEVRRDGEPGVYVFRKRRYDVNPSALRCRETFRLLVGTDRWPTRILKDEEEAGRHFPANAQVERVPIIYKKEFATDPEGALRDVVGVATDTISAFIPQRHKIVEAIVSGRARGLINWADTDDCALAERGMPQWEEGCFPTVAERARPRWAHIDLSISRDRCGVAVVSLSGFKQVRNSETGLAETAPVIEVDAVVGIKPSALTHIEPAEVRRWLLQLASHYHVNLIEVSFDGFNSLESRQAVSRTGIMAREISVDRTTDPYFNLRRMLYEDRILFPESELLQAELVNLEENKETAKIDHAPKFSKDLADAVCGASWACVTSRYVKTKVEYGFGGRGRERPHGRDRPQGRARR